MSGGRGFLRVTPGDNPSALPAGRGRGVKNELLAFFLEFPLFLALGTFLGLAAAVLRVAARGAFPCCHRYPSLHSAGYSYDTVLLFDERTPPV
jgi:hypothetical protein